MFLAGRVPTDAVQPADRTLTQPRSPLWKSFVLRHKMLEGAELGT